MRGDTAHNGVLASLCVDRVRDGGAMWSFGNLSFAGNASSGISLSVTVTSADMAAKFVMDIYKEPARPGCPRCSMLRITVLLASLLWRDGLCEGAMTARL